MRHARGGGAPLITDFEGASYHFCSALCQRIFNEHPALYAERAAARAVAPFRVSPWIAYFSMEIAVESDLPTYSGGLGVLAGDTLRTCADLAIPVVGVTLLHHKGYFFQALEEMGSQGELPCRWVPSNHLERLAPRVAVSIAGRTVQIQAWRYLVLGATGAPVPILFLDTDLAENAEGDRRLTDHLYGGDERYRLAQEIVLGVGGVRMLAALGYEDIGRFHMNEGHSSFLALELLK